MFVLLYPHLAPELVLCSPDRYRVEEVTVISL